jgi:broad specificity phosphatase PhoE
MKDWKVPLTDEGREQAKKVGLELGYLFNPLILYSPYDRAKETAEIINNQYLKSPFIFECPMIKERSWGDLREEVTQKTGKERKELFDFFHRPNGGESFFDAYQRAFIFFEYLKKEYSDTNDIIIVSHGEFLKVLLMIIDKKTVEEFDNLPNIKNCEIHKRTIYV